MTSEFNRKQKAQNLELAMRMARETKERGGKPDVAHIKKVCKLNKMEVELTGIDDGWANKLREARKIKST